VDSAGNAYVTGRTSSSDFPVTAGALQTTYGGAGGQAISQFSTGDAFVMKLDPTGKTIYSTYLGGSKHDLGIGIAIDGDGNAFVSGSTISTNFPLVKAFQTTNKGAGGEANFIAGDGFVAKLNPQGNALVYSSLIGGSKDDRASAIGVDQSGNAFIRAIRCRRISRLRRMRARRHIRVRSRICRSRQAMPSLHRSVRRAL
jgi:hypothetical protein